MNYIAIDIETTGLNSLSDQILEIGAVHSGGNTFHRIIKWDRITGNPFAICMNIDVIREGYKSGIPCGQAMEELVNWIGDSKIVLAGKNVHFDLSFLKQWPQWDRVKHYHRFLDPAILYIQDGDKVPPDLNECCKRAGINGGTAHRALDDAQAVVALLKAKGI